MVTENPRESESRAPEHKEWQGQGWEYLVFKLRGYRVLDVVGEREGGGFFSLGKHPVPIANYYDEVIRKMTRENPQVTIFDYLNALGRDGWELVASAPDAEISLHSFLFLKRPIPPSK